jgi:hypothetical protein
VSHATADVHEEDITQAGIETFGKAVRNGIEARVNPRGLSGAVSRHVVVEDLEVRWILIQPGEERQICIVCSLEGSVCQLRRE